MIKEREELEAELYRQIGQLKVELEWLKKNLFSSVEKKRKMIEPLNPEIPVYRQCELIGLPRSSYYSDFPGSIIRRRRHYITTQKNDTTMFKINMSSITLFLISKSPSLSCLNCHTL